MQSFRRSLLRNTCTVAVLFGMLYKEVQYLGSGLNPERVIFLITGRAV